MSKEATGASPAPWRWGGEIGSWTLRDANGSAVVYGSRVTDSIEVATEADERIIAAAPDMAAMLRELEVAINACPIGIGEDITRRLAALLEAIGRAP